MKSILRLIATSCVVSSLTATAQTPILVRTFNNPTPNGVDNFGSWVAPLGNDRILIGARYDAIGCQSITIPPYSSQFPVIDPSRLEQAQNPYCIGIG